MKRKILIAYYSHSTNTKKIATMIQHEVGGTLCEIQPEVEYPTVYHAVVEQAKQEIQMGVYPAIKSKIGDIEAYDTIFIGSPNWWSTVAPPIATFLKEHDLSGKVVIPFCTHGGGGTGSIERDIAKLCPKSTMRSVFSIYGDGGRDAEVHISKWLEKIKIDGKQK